MTISYVAAVRNAMLDVLTTEVGASGKLKIYDGTPPVNASASLSGNTLLAELTLASTLAPSASGGVLTFDTITSDSSADASGTATFFRITTSGGTVKAQGSVGTSGADLNLVSTSISAGGTVGVASMAITEGNL